MYILKGFYEYPSLIDNNTDKVSKFGEISDNSLTYSKNKTIHTNQTTPNVGLISFHSVRDNLPVNVEVAYALPILKLGEFIYQRANDGTIGATTTPSGINQMILAEFSGIVKDITSGPVSGYNNRYYMPEYIEFTLEAPNDEPNLIRIWLSDEAFSGQYDQYTIEVIHPIEKNLQGNFDDWFKDPTTIKELLAAYNWPEKLQEVQERRAQYPFTYQSAYSFNYVTPGKPNLQWAANWIVIIYGIAGNNLDLIKDKITSDLLENSTHTREEWETILPELFRTTEFIATPFFNNIAIENRDFRGGIYSPTMDPRKLLTLIQRTARGNSYNPTYVANNYELSSVLYRSLGFSMLGNPKNPINKFSLMFPDYILVTNISDDIDRVSVITKDWMLLFNKLIKAAEEMTPYTSIPQGISRIIRDGIVYASAIYKNVNYLVVTKYSVDSVVT